MLPRRLSTSGPVRWPTLRMTLLALSSATCLGMGHVKASNNSIDRIGCYYQCKWQGYTVRECQALANYPACAAIGKPVQHQIGVGVGCVVSKRRQRKGGESPASESILRIISQAAWEDHWDTFECWEGLSPSQQRSSLLVYWSRTNEDVPEGGQEIIARRYTFSKRTWITLAPRRTCSSVQ